MKRSILILVLLLAVASAWAADATFRSIDNGTVTVSRSAGLRETARSRDELESGRNLAIGITPTDREDWANPHVDIVIPTGMGWARNAVITRTAWAVIAVGGCAGTLSELAFAWQMDKPIVAMNTTGGWAARLAGQSIDDRRPDTIMEAADAAQAIALIKPRIEDKEK